MDSLWSRMAHRFRLRREDRPALRPAEELQLLQEDRLGAVQHQVLLPHPEQAVHRVALTVLP